MSAAQVTVGGPSSSDNSQTCTLTIPVLLVAVMLGPLPLGTAIVAGAVNEARSRTPQAAQQTVAQKPPAISEDEVKARRLRAEQGDADAQFHVGSMYGMGQGVPQDFVEAVKWWTKAADQGHAGAQVSLAAAYTNGKGVRQDFAEAVKWNRKAADQGNAIAQFGLGVAYTNGQGVPQDDREAVKWWRTAADQGFAIAQYHLGNMYVSGRGVPQDDGEAVKWWRMAADQGFAGAQLPLGLAYTLGHGVAQDHAEAHKWFSIAYALSSGKFQKQCAEARQAAATMMTPAQIAEAQKRAREWLEAFEARKKK